MFTQIFLSEIISIAENGGQGTHFLISQILKGLTHSAMHYAFFRKKRVKNVHCSTLDYYFSVNFYQKIEKSGTKLLNSPIIWGLLFEKNDKTGRKKPVQGVYSSQDWSQFKPFAIFFVKRAF